MRFFSLACSLVFVNLLLSACAGQPKKLAAPDDAPALALAETEEGTGSTELKKLAAAGDAPTLAFAEAEEGIGSTGAFAASRFPLDRSFSPVATPLTGRTLYVGEIGDIQLAPREVVLTFDDGPMPGKTRRILDTLDRFGVGATFLMVGEMAANYPEIARDVAARGHTIGTHTHGHLNLRRLSADAAIAEIRRGERSVAAALAPAGRRPAPFFRFPYLADTDTLRRSLASQGIVAIDVDVDSKDYFQTPPHMVEERTLKALARHGRGIILFHDIHRRTASMLPGFLEELEARGYKVVHLKPKPEGYVEELLVSENVR